MASNSPTLTSEAGLVERNASKERRIEMNAARPDVGIHRDRQKPHAASADASVVCWKAMLPRSDTEANEIKVVPGIE